MKRNSLIIICLLTAMLAFSISCTQEEQPPNIMFIAVDDMNDWIGPLGGLEISKTPNLDRLASLGMVFTNAHCASPACSPSRLSIMTGVQPSKSGKMKNEWYDGPEWRKETIFQDIETIEQFFQNRGYETLAGERFTTPWRRPGK